MSNATDLGRYRANWQDEIDSAALYNALAQTEKQPQLAGVYARLAATEQQHADFWEAQLRAAGQSVPAPKISGRTRTLIWLAKRFGPSFVLPTISGLEQSDSRDYRAQAESKGTQLPTEERSHARLLQTIVTGTPGGLEGSSIARLEGRHRVTSGNALRAAVLGASDGLLSNFSLVMGVAGASLNGQGVLVAGLAGLLAGAFSMALGEWISVKSSRELYERQIATERAELEHAPEEERAELALIYESKGLTQAQAKTLAGQLSADPQTALDTLAREELGLDPAEMGGSAMEAAITSFLLFAIGAIIPVLPFLFGNGMPAVVVSVALSTIGLFAIGAAITLFTGRGVLFSGARQVVIGLAAAAITFGIGRLLGVAVAG
jgi:VIT1/CCC1 family predicted Fe2+/Mn2+ transporter